MTPYDLALLADRCVLVACIIAGAVVAVLMVAGIV